MRQSNGCRHIALVLALLTVATPGQARRLLETDGIELHGTARVLEYGAGTCHVLEASHTAEEYERIKGNEGKPLDVWQLDFSVYNGSGKALDHLIALYGIESPWPPCTNWSDSYSKPLKWTDTSGHIQRSGKPFSVAPGETLTEEIFIIAFHGDAPRFDDWRVNFTFAEGVHAAPGAQPPQPQAAPPAAQPAPAQAAAPQPAPAPGLSSGISAGETCAGKPEKSACWQELDNQPECYLWNANLQVNETVTWSGACAGGLAEGAGEMTWVSGSPPEHSSTDTGKLQQGRRHGQWVERGADGDVREGPYVDGKRHGQWVERNANGSVWEGPYVDGKLHGQWVFRYANGDVHEGPIVDNKPHGQWVERGADGDVREGPFVDGKRHGQWVIRYANGSVYEGPYVDGKQTGHWVKRFADDGSTPSAMVYEGPYVDGKRHGHWVERHRGFWGIAVFEGPYVDDKRHGRWVTRWGNGGGEEGPYVDGKRHGRWVERNPDGTVEVQHWENDRPQ